MTKYEKSKNLLLTLNNISKDDLKEIARKENRSVNGFINEAIDKHIKNKNK